MHDDEDLAFTCDTGDPAESGVPADERWQTIQLLPALVVLIIAMLGPPPDSGGDAAAAPPSSPSVGSAGGR